jgi:negative regulator of flagellin synthesis FlgM
MKVTQSGNSPVQSSESKKAGRATVAQKAEGAKKTDGASKSEAARTVPGSARAEISGKAKEMVKAKSVAEATPDVREDKIAELKRRIEAGTYAVEPEAIADKMFDEHMATAAIS